VHVIDDENINNAQTVLTQNQAADAQGAFQISGEQYDKIELHESIVRENHLPKNEFDLLKERMENLASADNPREH
jgi:hypothetical protein